MKIRNTTSRLSIGFIASGFSSNVHRRQPTTQPIGLQTFNHLASGKKAAKRNEKISTGTFLG
jgi:hypothetical protein